ncbi:MAG: C40 family peptidase [Armatimonadetes bacterium]|nr:C40 family peptidase [Armatimonadota bacterium]
MHATRRWMVVLAAFGCLLNLAMAAPQAQATAKSDPNMRKIGILGQSIEKTKIFASMNERGRTVWDDLKAYQYLVVNETKYDKWLAVLLQNGKTGYILTEKVAILPYDVEVPKNFNFTSRSSNSRTGNRSGGIRPSGNPTGTPKSKQEMLEYSFKYMGTPYKWGGNDLVRGIDCSGFVKELFEMIGEDLPRTAREQARVGQKIERIEDLQPGDRLYFWDKKRNMIGHTGIFLGFFADGGAYFIHSSSNNKGVDTDDLRNQKWRNMLVGARR